MAQTNTQSGGDLTARTAILFVVLLAVAMALRPLVPTGNSGMGVGEFWSHKKFCSPAADVVLIGDSRTFGDLCPAAMEACFSQKLNVFNFGFQSGGLNTFMFDKALAKFNPDRRTPRAIVLGVTPHGLLERSRDNEHYHTIEPALPYIDRYVEPLDLTALIDRFAHRRQDMYSRRYCADGWCGMNLTPPDPGMWPPIYKAIYQNHQVSPSVVEDILAYTRKWREEGYYVFALRPPTTAEMVAVENTYSGFLEEDFVRKFQAAGGIWYAASSEGMDTIDGSHLSAESARRLSENLARFMEEKMSDRRQAQLHSTEDGDNPG